MASVDPSRPHYLRDIVFAVASLTLLSGVLWLGVRDYNQDWKQAQRLFREVETVRSERAFLDTVPEDLDQFHQLQSEVRLAREVVQKAQAANKARDQVVSVEATAELTEKDDAGKVTKSEQKTYPARIFNHRVVFVVPQNDTAVILQDLRDGQLVPLKGVPPTADGIQVTLARAEEAQKSAEDRLRKITDNLDRYAREVIAKSGSGNGGWRSLPLVADLTAPTTIHDISLPDLPLNPSKPQQGWRTDRCTTCHLGIDQHSYDRTALAELGRVPEGAQRRLRIARTIFEARSKNGENLGFDPAQLPRKVRTLSLTSSQVGQFAAHPRLDLFVGPDSPHSVNKFGCTVCHAGQGSAVEFSQAGHTPNDALQERQWRQEHGASATTGKGSAMEANRFVESSCLKCHPQVTDLIREGVKEEAPKLLKGYNLVREMGCFGCHDITGYKDGRPIGPDMRLEPSANGERFPAGDVDPTLPPGTYRKVGPSLRKLAAKTDEEWTRRWLLAPRGFRPDTRMPHFYNLGTNSPDALSGTGQEKFPEAEVNAIAHYLFQESERAKGDKQIVFDSDGRAVPLPPAADMKDKEVLVRARNLFTEKGCLACHVHDGTAKSVADRDKQARITSDAHFGPDLSRLAGKLTGANGSEVGRRWLVQWLLNPNRYHSRTRMPVTFLEPREAAEIADWLLSQPDPALDDVRIQVGRIEGLIGQEIDVDEKEKAKLDAERQERAELRLALTNACHGLSAFARAWTPYNLAEVNAEADKLEQALAQLKAPYEVYEVGVEQLQQAIRMKWPFEALQKALTDKYQARLAEKQQALIDTLPGVKEAAKALFQSTKKPFPTTDEATLRQLANVYGIGPQEETYTVEDLKSYVGKKSIARLGCYGCHDIAGFESTRPVGSGLNDWGRKPTEQLAFENSAAYVRENYHITPLRLTRSDLEQRIRKLDRPARIRELEARGQSAAKLLDEERVELKSLKERGPLTEEEKRELNTLKNVLDKDPWQAQSADGKPPFEKWLYEALEHHNREGFLNLKLADPRSYDFQKKPQWDERLRMPQYRFAGAVKRRAGESDEAYASRVDKEEAEGREAVMTFVLGLVAEPMPLATMHRPDADRQAEIMGRQVLDKYNCAGCHVIRPGLFELKPSAETQARLIERYKPDPNDFVAEGHSAWTPRPAGRADEMRVFGMPWPAGKPRFNARDPGEEGRPLVVRLTEALRVQGPDGTSVAIPAGDEVRLPYGELRSRHDPYGGAFVETLFAYVRKKRPEERIDSSAGDDPPTEDRDKARNFLPPPLLREGERVQPEWLYQFLLHPQPIRSYTILRMPRFNMSAEEARALVDYFNGVSRLENPGANLPRTYADLPQRDPAFWENQNNAYLRRLKEKNVLDGRIADLKPGWKLVLEQRRAAMDRQIELMRGVVDAEQKPALLALSQARTAGSNAVAALVLGRSDLTPTAAAWSSLLEAEKALKPAEEAFKKVQESDNLARLVILEKLRKELTWEAAADELKPEYEKNAYAADGYRLLMGHGGNICLSCHSIGNVGTPGVAPRLDRVSDRLRPEWLEHWLGRPARMLAYSPKMNANFEHGKETSQNLFVGTSSEQIMALRDVLLHYPWVAELPVNRYYAVPGKFYQDAIPKEVPK